MEMQLLALRSVEGLWDSVYSCGIPLDLSQDCAQYRIGNQQPMESTVRDERRIEREGRKDALHQHQHRHCICPDDPRDVLDSEVCWNRGKRHVNLPLVSAHSLTYSP